MFGREKKPREYRGVIDEIREQQRKTRDMTGKGKLEYFWEYYKVHTIVGILVIVMAVTLIHDIVTAKDYIFSGILMNSFQLAAEPLENAFAQYAGIDQDEYECFIDTSAALSLTTYDQYNMATVQKLMAQMQTGDLDVLVFDAEIFNNYSLNEMFKDLRTVMSKEELAEYEDRLYYIDYVEVLKKAEEDMEPLDDVMELPVEVDVAAETELHRHPENMEDPVPIGVFLTDSPFVEKSGSYAREAEPIFGIVSTSERDNVALQYLHFLWDDSIDFSQVINPGLF